MSQMEYPKLFILETQRERTFKVRLKISVNNRNIFAYVNSKFVYVEIHIKTQSIKLYMNIMEQQCALEKQILQNALLFQHCIEQNGFSNSENLGLHVCRHSRGNSFD